MRHPHLNLIGMVLLCSALLMWQAPAEGAVPRTVATASQPRRPLIKRLSGNITRFLRGVRLRTGRAWRRWNRPPTPQQALRPLRAMIQGGRISGADLDRVRALYPQLGSGDSQPRIRSSRSDPRMKPLFRMLDSGRISATDLVQVERALGR